MRVQLTMVSLIRCFYQINLIISLYAWLKHCTWAWKFVVIGSAWKLKVAVVVLKSWSIFLLLDCRFSEHEFMRPRQIAINKTCEWIQFGFLNKSTVWKSMEVMVESFGSYSTKADNVFLTPQVKLLKLGLKLNLCIKIRYFDYNTNLFSAALKLVTLCYLFQYWETSSGSSPATSVWLKERLLSWSVRPLEGILSLLSCGGRTDKW